MPREKAKRWPLPKRFNVAMTDRAYARLRSLSDRTGLGNNYLLTILLENLDRYADTRELDLVFEEIFAEYGQPKPASVKGVTQ
ncbi:MAG: hypothetical protein AAGD23_05095 [Pseudomonadota bacterium]